MQISPPPPVMSERRTAILGAALVAIGPISMALYTPAMPTLAAVFDTSPSVIKLTLTAYFAGFALTQLICGPLTDAYGRRPVTLWFLALYLVATAVATWAPTVEWLIVARLIQGVGAAVGMAVSRAIVRDQYIGQASSRILNAVGMMLAVGPAVSPTIGGITLTLFGWQQIFYFMILYGVALGLAVFFLLPETNTAPDPTRAHPRRLVNAYLTLCVTPVFLRPSLFIGLSLGCIYTMATIIPFVMIEHVGLTPAQFGFGMMLQSACYFSGTIVTSRLMRRFDADNLVPWSIAGMLVAMSLLAVMLHQPDFGYLMVMGPIGLFTFSLAHAIPATTTWALASFPRMAGSAASMMGFIQFGSGFAGSIVAAWIGDPVLAMATVAPAMPVIGVIAYVVLGLVMRRQSPARM
ncbi:DHA1 family bicyclomycin/chloramphenicol resistance-like MFS transporter [Breoghania corrubedonensis]|uniref:Bcr/CflA family efflux transporter n=1 Tax=Breoghania corrubedonensis TaxID=665038 RepID=A0A2T5VI68_9HYPH|nr:multidrug effflux MFS transporter [Breoghania corrubedonensis]PTW63453.1 DHA1 family bicyclomycin/chloramphenicol resistance-like MFS transporter [Breoghania corrubedonensis]